MSKLTKFQNKGYFVIILASLLLLSTVNVHAMDSSQVENNRVNSVDEKIKNIVDLRIEGEIYLSRADPKVGEEVSIYAMIRNSGTITNEVKITFTIENDDQSNTFESSIYTLQPDEERYGQISWIATEGENIITAEAIVINGNDINPSNNIKKTIIKVSDGKNTDFGLNVDDISITPVENSNSYRITGLITNGKDAPSSEAGSLTLEVKDSTYGSTTLLSSQRIDIDANNQEYFSITFIPSRSYHLLEFILSDFSIEDYDRSNNRVTKEFHLPEKLVERLDLEISDNLISGESFEILQNSQLSIPLEITSDTISDDFQIIVGGITQNVKVTPSQWVLSITPKTVQILTIYVTVNSNLEVGASHNVEVQLYQRSDPSQIIKHVIPIVIVDDQDNTVSSFSLQSQNLQNNNLISIDETNDPVIENVTILPQYPNHSENVTVTADISDESTIDNATLYYSYDGGSSWITSEMTFVSGNTYSGQITTQNIETTVLYFVNAVDNFTNSINSTQYSFLHDGTTPNVPVLTNPGIVSTQQTTTIYANVTDNVGIDNSTAFLYYSYDNSTFSMLQMNVFNGTGQSYVFNGVIPATTNPTVYYYIEISDVSGLLGNTTIQSYSTDDLPTINTVSTNPEYPNASNITTVYANITDDVAINNATLYYSYLNNSGSIPMTESGGIYSADIPATINDTTVLYNITTYDSFGHNIWSTMYSYYSDAILPTISGVTLSDTTPNYLQELNVTAIVNDTNLLRNVTLYYSFDGGNTYNSVNMTQAPATTLPNYTADVLVVYSDSQDRSYLTRNGYTYNLMTAFAFSSTSPATLGQYRIIILEPNWSTYGYLRAGLTILDQALDEYNIAVGIRVAGNQGSQVDIDFFDADYNRLLNNIESFVDGSHPFITGAPWSGNTLTTTNFNSWGYTDHGFISNRPTSQPGYQEILQNDDGISMYEYDYKESPILVDALTSIDGGWGSGNDAVANNYINYLNYTFYESLSNRIDPNTYSGIIPSAPADTTVYYYVNGTDMANNSKISEISTYFADGTGPQYANISQYNLVSETDTVTINATVFDNVGLDNTTVSLFYTYDNITYYQLSMAILSVNSTYGIFQANIPITSQPEVYYYIQATDISGLTSNSFNSSYLIDTRPTLISTVIDPLYPHANFSTTINATISDDFGITSANLYYNTNGTWLKLVMNLVDTIYQVTIPAINFDTTVFYMVEMNDTYGHMVNSTSSSYYSDGLTPMIDSITLNPTIPNSNSNINVTATISDLSGIQNATLHYSDDNGTTWTNLTMSFNSGNWEATIPAFNTSVSVDYFVSTFDNTGYFSNSSIGTFQTDQLNPEIYNVTSIGIVSEFDVIIVNATITDNLGIDPNNVILHYSTDNSTWSSVAMTNITGNSTIGTFQGLIPALTGPTVYYYVSATDLSTRYNETGISTYTVDNAPIVSIDTIDPTIASAFRSVTVNSTLSDDFGIVEATLFYNFNSTWYQVSMTNVSGTFVGNIPAINVDATVNYYISGVDTYGHRINSTTLNYYADGILPTLTNIEFTPTTPQGTDDISVIFDADDNQDLLNTTLYYNYNGTWIPIVANQLVDQTYTGRSPATGYHYGITVTNDYGTEPLSSLSVYVYSSDSDTLYVTLWGYRIDTNSWEQFYYSGSRGSGNLPTQTWANPIYDQWRIQIYDSENNDNIYYSYSYDQIEGYEAIIPALNQSANVEFYLEGYDVALNQYTTISYFFSVDVDPPMVTGVSNPGLTSEITTATITADVSDLVAIDPTNVLIHYTFDNLTYYSVQMTQSSGDNQTATFTGDIPAVDQDMVYYYVNATDLSGFTGKSLVQSYAINHIPDILSSSIQPDYPDINTIVDVSANITDDDSITSVTLNYEFGNGVSGSTAMSLSNGLYTGEIPATSMHTQVLYYYTISDSFGHIINSQNYTYFADGRAPSISGVSHTPSVPTNVDSVTVTSSISDDSNVKTALIYYSINNGNSWNSVTMSGTGTYSGIIPAQAGGTTVQYYVFAEDRAGNTNTSLTKSYFVDSQAPVIETIHQVSLVSALNSVTINTTISDNYAIDDSSVRLYYSYNNISYFQLAMSKLGGTSTFGIYEATIPSTTNAIVYYYVEVQDQSGLSSITTTYSYDVDRIPVILSYNHLPSLPSGGAPIEFEVDATDDFGIANITLHYNYNSVWYSTLFNPDLNLFRASIGPINFDGDLTYYIEVYDTFGHSVISSQVVQYVDNINPNIGSIQQTPVQPSDASTVQVISQITDQNGIANATLYYSVNGSSWNSIVMSQAAPNTVTGREPATGYHYGITVTNDYGSDPLTSLSIYVYSGDSDTLYVTLWGYRIDTNTWEQFYYSGSRGSGNLPTQTWGVPIYDQWRIQIYDSENNDNIYYSYSYDELSNWDVDIPGYSESSNITYYIQSFDNAGNSATSSNYSYLVDSINPNIANVSQPLYSSTSDSVEIRGTLSDYAGINVANSLLYYSYDNITWSTIALSLESGNNQLGTYLGIIPATTSEQTVYYYILAEDNSGYISESLRYTYSTLDVTIQLDNPTDGSVLNGTGEIDLSFLIIPGNSTVEITYDQGNSWSSIANISSNIYLTTINATELPEGEFIFSINVTIPQGVSFIREYSLFIDRSAPEILEVDYLPVIDGSGQTVNAVIREAVTQSNFVVTLFYSYDNSTWFQTSMSQVSQNNGNFTYSGLLPQTTTEEEVYFYIYVEDNLGLNNQSLSFLSQIDYTPIIDNVIINGEYYRSDTSTQISTEVTDDRGIASVVIVYTVGSNTYEVPMTLQSSLYTGSIPAIGSDTYVTYYIKVTDIFGHVVNSDVNEIYIDGSDPIIQNSIRTQSHSNNLELVDVLVNVYDTNPIQSLELYYSKDGSTWQMVNFNPTSTDQIQGRYPVGGNFVNTTHTNIFDSGPLQRLALTVGTTGNSLAVKIWGYRIDSGTYQLIYDNNNMVSSQLPVFNWGTPIFEKWMIEITEVDPTDGFFYSYDMDVISGYQAQIPQSQINGITQYYIVVTDMANRTFTSEIYSYYTDGIAPKISEITQFDPVSQFDTARVFANISDNVGINTPVLYYSNDEITWYSAAMSISTNNATLGLYYADIPAFDSGLVAYYIVSNDYYDLQTKSFTWYYAIDEQADIQFLTHYPTDISLNDAITFTTYATDDYRVESVTLYYWTDSSVNSVPMLLQNGAYTAQIPALKADTSMYYYISVIDSFGHFTNSTIDQLVIDGSNPTIRYTQTPGLSIDGPENIVIRISASDNAALNLTSGIIYYSYNQVDWYSSPMQQAGGNTGFASFVGLIPDTPTNWIYYYASISDRVGLTNYTEVKSYYLESFPDRDNDKVADWTEENLYGSNPDNNDTDGDELNDYDEIYVFNTDVNNPDTDGDGMPDGWEVEYSFDPLVADGAGDRDGDGLSNTGEYENGTDPDVQDTDNDGMDDGYEVEYGLNPLVDDTNQDNDNDDLTNIEEYGYGTNPSSNDTEGDGMPDGWEVLNQLNPLADDSQNDTDGDDLVNLDEYLNNTDPNSRDTDGDGMTDGYEVTYGLNPLVDDAGEDPDGDGWTNFAEFELGSDPFDPDSPGSGIIGAIVGIGIVGVSAVGLSIAIRRAGGLKAFLENLRPRGGRED